MQNYTEFWLQEVLGAKAIKHIDGQVNDKKNHNNTSILGMLTEGHMGNPLCRF